MMDFIATKPIFKPNNSITIYDVDAQSLNNNIILQKTENDKSLQK